MQALQCLRTIRLIENLRRRKVYRQRFDPFSLDDEEFRARYRFTKSTAKFIVDLVREELQLNSQGFGTSPELQVLTAIKCWGRREVQEDAGDIHGLSQATTSRICSRVARALARHADEYIRMPTSFPEELQLMKEFHKIKGLPSVIGSIACTHVKIKKPGADIAPYYFNRQGYYSLNIQVTCDSNLQIMDIVAESGGSTDVRIFHESTLKRRFETGKFRGRLVGESSYGPEPYLLTPILTPKSSAEEKYNEAHAATVNVVENCFDLWKQRFQCLLHGMTGELGNVKTTIVALAVLHNIAMTQETFHIKEEYENDYMFDQTIALDSNLGQERNSTLQEFIVKHFGE